MDALDLPEVDSRRRLVVQTAIAEFERVSALDAAGVAEFLKTGVAVYWADVLRQSLTAPHPPEWCGGFALWCLHQAGLGLGARWMFGPPHYGFLYNLNQLGRDALPEPGDIAYLDRPYQHHAVVLCVEGDLVHTVDGNQGRQKPIKRYEQPLRHWTAFYSIDPWLEPEDVA